MKPRRHTMRVQMATQYALVTIVAGTVFVAVNFGVIERDTSGLTDALVGLGVITVAAAAAGWGIARYTLRPLRAVTATARRISANTLDERIGLEGPDDELQQLAMTIDDLLARLEAGFERERRFVANASHEIRTPLAVTRTALELGLDKPDPTVEELRVVIAKALEATGRSEALAADLLLLTQSEQLPSGRCEHVDLAEVAAGIVDDLAPSAEAAQVALATDLMPTPTLGNTALVDRLVANLVDNAIRHNEPGGWVKVATAADAAAARITVRNHTPAEPAEPVDELFQPFRRGAVPPGRTPSAGHGLGLSIVRAIAAGHGAELHAEREPTGDVFQVAVRFPNPPPAASDGHGSV